MKATLRAKPYVKPSQPPPEHCATVFAGDADLSTGIVGYKSFECKANTFYLIAAQFEKVGGGSVNLQDFVKGDFAADSSAKIQLWDPTAASGAGGYKEYSFMNRSRNTGAGITSWQYSVWSTGNNTYDPNVTVDIGVGAWFKCTKACTISIAGQVAEISSTPIPVTAGKFNLIANPYPKALVLNSDVDWSAFTADGTAKIQVWDPTAASGAGGYKEYSYMNRSRNTGAGITSWQYSVWSTGNNTYDPNAQIPVGEGFWLKYTGENKTISFVR